MTDCEWTEQDTVLESILKIHQFLTLRKALYPALDILRTILAQTQNENCLTPNYACQKCPCLTGTAKLYSRSMDSLGSLRSLDFGDDRSYPEHSTSKIEYSEPRNSIMGGQSHE